MQGLFVCEVLPHLFSAAALRPGHIAFDGANMLMANYFSNTVSVLRASDGFHVMPPAVGSNP